MWSTSLTAPTEPCLMRDTAFAIGLTKRLLATKLQVRSRDRANHRSEHLHLRQADHLQHHQAHSHHKAPQLRRRKDQVWPHQPLT